jgi:multicomponent Na+:H+ antiporter subunit D
MPPFATFFGIATLEQAASASGYWWISIVTAVVAVATGGAVLRITGRTFLGLGRGTPQRRHKEKDHVEKPSPISHVMTAPAVALLVVGAVVGLPHGFRDSSLQYSIRFQDSQAYSHHVLEGTSMPPVPARSADISISDVVKSGLITLVAAVLAWLSLTPRFIRLPRFLRLPMDALRSVHSGIVGDYVMWMIVGVVALGAVFLWIL